MGQLPRHKRVGNDADHFAATGQDAIGQDTHHPYASAAVDQSDAAAREQRTEPLSGLGVNG
jgi:hypothetical protein